MIKQLPFRLFFSLLLLALSLSSNAWGAKVPALNETINPLPGPSNYFPITIAVNHNTKRLYIGGNTAFAGQVGRITVIDMQTNEVVTAFAIPREISAIAINETTNTLYVSSFYDVGFNRLPQAVKIDASTNQVTATYDNVNLGNQLLVDNVTGRLFATGYTDHSQVSVFDGSTLANIQNISIADGSGNYYATAMSLNSANGIVYVTGQTSNNGGTLAAINISQLTTAYTHINGYPGNVASDPGTNRTYVGTSLSDGNGSYVPKILVYDGSNSLIKTIDLTSDDYDIPGGVRTGTTVDAGRHRVYFSGEAYPSHHSLIVDTQSNAVVGALPEYFSAAGVNNDTGMLYVTQYTTFGVAQLERENAIGVINPANGDMATIQTGYLPLELAINKNTERLYVTDAVGNDVLVLDGNPGHAVLARVKIGGTDPKHIVSQRGPAAIAVSEAQNRFYVRRNDPTNSVTGEGGASVVDVFDGASNALLQSIIVSAGDSVAGHVAVDDTRAKLYVTARDTSNSNQGTVYVFSLIDHSLITKIPADGAGYVAVNPTTGRVYVTGAASFGGAAVRIINGNTNQLVTTVTAGSVPGPMVVNTKTNKIYIANTGAGSVDNTVTVIDGATDSVERTFQNATPSNAHDVSAVGVDDITNTVFASDGGNGSSATGNLSVFDPATNYTLLSQVPLGTYPGQMIFDSVTRLLYVTSYYDGAISVLGNGVPPGPPVPLHGGLSATVFRINGSQSPAGNLADTALHFSAQQSGTPEGLIVRVQINTVADNNRNDWVTLNNGSGHGYMTIDKSTEQFVLSSTNYPNANGIYFRALSSAPGYPDSKSNIIGPLNLSYGQAHLSHTTLYGKTNGAGQEMNLRADVGVDQAGITLFIQTTTTPDDDASWVGLNDGRAGQMNEYDTHTSFYLDTTKYPNGDPVYFRAVATAPGFVPSYSNIVGITDVVNGAQPTLDIVPPFPQPGSQSGVDADHPIIAAMGTLTLGVTNAVSPDGKAIKKIGLVYDGATIEARETSASSMNTQYLTNVPGDHVIKAFAIDERGIAGYAQPVYIRIKPAGGKLFRMVGSGDWSSPTSWRDEDNFSGVPGPNDFAVISAANATISQNVSAFVVSLTSGSITGAGGGLTIDKFFTVAGGSLKNLNLTINSGAILAVVSDTHIPASGVVTNNGTVRITGRGGFVPVPNGAKAGKSPASPDGLFDGVAAFFKNAGEFVVNLPKKIVQALTPPSTPQPVPLKRGVYAAKFENAGHLISEKGLGLVTDNGSGIISNDGASIISNDGASLITNDGGSIISNDGASAISDNGAGLISPNGGTARAQVSSADAASALAGFVQTAGETDLNGFTFETSVSLSGGTLTGSGVIVGSLSNDSGFISPGHSAGTISVTGDFSQGANGTFVAEIGGKDIGQADHLQVDGTATLGGTLHVKAINGFVIDPADTFSPLGYGTVSGAFSSTGGNASASSNGSGVVVSLDPNAPQPQSGQPLNIATRMSVQAGDNVLIAGFIITGPSGSTKKVLIRGLGPSLAQFGVPNTIADPLLELHKSDGTVTNDNWQEGDTSQIPNGFAPGDPHEAVIVATLAPGNYSAVVKGAHGETGVGIAEVYDLDAASPAKLGNIATRGFINTGDDVMIGGFIVGGNEPAKILVRAIGPTLSDFGVQGALQDPTLELHDSNGMSISNDDWRETQEADIIATTIPPNKNQEPAILATLAPGNYTAVVRGKNNTTGIGLVEAYNLQ